MSSLGPLLPADEYFHHQITDTFATVAQSELSWTEKVWATALARDGSLALALGVGKYANRGVMDGMGGVARGREQFAVRASRELGAERDVYTVGPVRYEIVDPLRVIRFVLEPNEAQPVSFDWTFVGVVPPFLEDRERARSADGSRVATDLVRYHQTGTARGWVEIAGERTHFDDGAWVSTRDHSWGVRYSVGAPVPDLPPAPSREGVGTLVLWCPVLCERPDGSRYALHWYYQRDRTESRSTVRLQGGVEHPGGAKQHFAALVPELAFDPVNRRFRGGELRFTMEDGAERPLFVTPISDTGFHLGAGLYFGLDGHWHGQWRGPLHVEGEHTPDCTRPEVARRLHQLRDCLVRIEDPVGGGVGWGNLQSLALGPLPEFGLDASSSFV